MKRLKSPTKWWSDDDLDIDYDDMRSMSRGEMADLMDDLYRENQHLAAILEKKANPYKEELNRAKHQAQQEKEVADHLRKQDTKLQEELQTLKDSIDDIKRALNKAHEKDIQRILKHANEQTKNLTEEIHNLRAQIDALKNLKQPIPITRNLPTNLP